MIIEFDLHSDFPQLKRNAEALNLGVTRIMYPSMTKPFVRLEGDREDCVRFMEMYLMDDDSTIDDLLAQFVVDG